MDLATGQVTTVDRVKSFKVPEESGAFVAYLLGAAAEEARREEGRSQEGRGQARAKPEARRRKKPKSPRKRRRRRSPATTSSSASSPPGKETKIAEVVEYVWNKPGTWLAYGVSSKTPENDGAFALRSGDGQDGRPAQGPRQLQEPDLRREGRAARLHSATATTTSRRRPRRSTQARTIWTRGRRPRRPIELVPAAAKGLPAGHGRRARTASLQFSKDGGRLFFGVADAPKPEPKDAPEPVKVDIWSWKDPYLQPMQKVQAEEDKKRTLLCVVHFLPKEKKLVQLATADMPDITLSDDAKVALGAVRSPLPPARVLGPGLRRLLSSSA
ncbi:MAG: hypothetical protein MZV64_63110 [Ignavibacteriales bacterium]|nr:hypothetical protein [Ignavibacteriales bacterium]